MKKFLIIGLVIIAVISIAVVCYKKYQEKQIEQMKQEQVVLVENLEDAISKADINRVRKLIGKVSDINYVMEKEYDCVVDYNPKTGSHGDAICTKSFTLLDVAYTSWFQGKKEENENRLQIIELLKSKGARTIHEQYKRQNTTINR